MRYMDKCPAILLLITFCLVRGMLFAQDQPEDSSEGFLEVEHLRVDQLPKGAFITDLWNGRPYALEVNSETSDSTLIRTAIIREMGQQGLLAQVVFVKMENPSHNMEHAKDQELTINIGRRVEKRYAQAIITACVKLNRRPVSVTTNDDEFYQQYIHVYVLSMGGSAKQAALDRQKVRGPKAIAALLDNKLTQEEFAALLPEKLKSSPLPLPKHDGLIAKYGFSGNGNDSSGLARAFHLEETSYVEGALFLNGHYSKKEAAAEGLVPYQAQADIPELYYLDFTVSFEFNAKDFKDVGNGHAHDNLLTGGHHSRWFGLRRSSAGMLEVTFNNSDVVLTTHDSRIAPGTWHALVCGVDFSKRVVTVWLDGIVRKSLVIPPKLSLSVVEDNKYESGRDFGFKNSGNGHTFCGLIDNLTIYNGQLSEATMTELHAQARFHQNPLSTATSDDNAVDAPGNSDF